ncbi:glycosyltransferase family 39 protein [uncultured Ruegeria sp.]|uniref:glycosyltransferase family 39 protein n=1 Tax=uncultured Ruegeria sp. TaxID=259304 RepID=UPI002636004E|nr:glycosyltransferase family 39 protein [uncultured Ruegeria sp.]
MSHPLTGSYPSPSNDSGRIGSLVETDTFWLWLFGGYFILHVGVRLATGGALGLDEAEILLDARELSWGYGPQLPLYVWLQWLVFQITGPGLLGLSLLKNGILLATVTALYLTIRTRQNPVVAGISILSLLMLYQFSWESQRALTHTVLANLCSVLSFAVIWGLIRNPTTRGYVLLGVVMAAGGLSKYNYSIALIAILLAALSYPETRKPFLSARILLSAGLAALLMSTPMMWILNNQAIAFESVRKLDMADDGLTLMTTAQGLAELVLAALGFVALLLLVMGFLWLVHRRQATSIAADDLLRFMLRTVFWALVLMGLLVIISGTTNVKDRWLQPSLLFAGPAIVLWLSPKIRQSGIRRFSQISAGLAVLIVMGMLHHNLAGNAKRAAPFAVLTPQILEQTPPESMIVAHNWLAGNMAYLAPDRPIHSDRDMSLTGPILRVWEVGRKAPKDIDPASVVTLTAPYRFDDGEVMSLSFAPAIK